MYSLETIAKWAGPEAKNIKQQFVLTQSNLNGGMTFEVALNEPNVSSLERTLANWISNIDERPNGPNY